MLISSFPVRERAAADMKSENVSGFIGLSFQSMRCDIAARSGSSHQEPTPSSPTSISIVPAQVSKMLDRVFERHGIEVIDDAAMLSTWPQRPNGFFGGAVSCYIFIGKISIGESGGARINNQFRSTMRRWLLRQEAVSVLSAAIAAVLLIAFALTLFEWLPVLSYVRPHFRHRDFEGPRDRTIHLYGGPLPEGQIGAGFPPAIEYEKQQASRNTTRPIATVENIIRSRLSNRRMT
jgi:hypothetical protein